MARPPVPPPLGPVVPVKGSVSWSPGPRGPREATPLSAAAPVKRTHGQVPFAGGGVEPPGAPPGQGRAPRSVAWGARRPPTTRLAVAWVIPLGGDIYRLGARQGATPPSTPAHEVDSGQGSSDPETYTYTFSRGPSPRHPSAPSRARLPANRAILHPPRQPQGPGGRPGCLWGPRTAAPGPLAAQRPRPFSLIPPLSAAPPICPSFVANWRMLGAYRDRRPEPLPLRQGRAP